MMMKRRCLALTAALLVAIPLAAQSPEQVLTTAVRDGWHTVRPGESLWLIAARYLGAESEWETIHALNPEISDPHVIAPGQRIRVQVAPQYAGDIAKVVKISRRVEEQLTPHPWTESSIENLLNPRDGMRTFEESSSEILFADNSRLVVGEDSLVFLGRGGKVERRVRREEIEIVMGQGDFDGGLEAKSREFVVGGSRMKPADGDVIQTRLRRAEGGNSQVMVYEGEGAVESAGATQQVETGMGTQMKDGEPPAPPEKLLPAAEPMGPEADSEWRVADPPFTWSPVEGAAGYVLEVCLDAECGQLVARTGGIEQAEYGTADLTVGSFFWRVTPVSESGLDGYPSETTPFTIVSLGGDVTAPVIQTAFIGTQVERSKTQVQRASMLYLGVGAKLEVEVEDHESGVERVWAELDGVEVELTAAQGPWEQGPHEVVIHASDAAGNTSATDPLVFVYDTVGPEIHWSRHGYGPGDGLARHRRFRGDGLWYTDLDLHSYVGVQEPVDRPFGRRTRQGRLVTWSYDGLRWLPVGSDVQSLGGTDVPQFFIHNGGHFTPIYPGFEIYLPLRRNKGIGVLARDALVGTEQLDFRVEQAGDDGRADPRLVIETADWLGNRTSVSWPLGRGWGTGSR